MNEGTLTMSRQNLISPLLLHKFVVRSLHIHQKVAYSQQQLDLPLRWLPSTTVDHGHTINSARLDRYQISCDLHLTVNGYSKTTTTTVTRSCGRTNYLSCLKNKRKML